ncbi:MAG: hypothetical protein HWQ35_03820 [Nostoc sp. NMS1]|uniref:hypothetical protein n=1 Tax=unclassified Nostoc TaxID=2593658 RepID=UPI0025CD8128|nr:MULTISPECIES: hypothetical protein [unclassified Nostoc]MBN3905726.1 hypothetical protein [Nostoc sp. NMS1]MBN3989072.1 hypothetical protein [Nostoc sp. NMS2]
MKSLTPEIIRAITPMFMATIGAVIGVAVLVSPKITDAKWSAGLGLAGTAIAGAAGLAQNSKNEQDFSVKKQGDNFEVETPGSESTDRH